MASNNENISSAANAAHDAITSAEATVRSAFSSAEDTAKAAADKASSAYDSLKDKAGDYAEKAGDYADKAGAKVKDAATSGKDMAADGLHNLADATRNVAGKYADGKAKPVADYAAKAADGLDRFSGTLKNKSVDDLTSDAKGFVKEHPAIAVGAAALIGFALARFLKSSGSDGRDA